MAHPPGPHVEVEVVDRRAVFDRPWGDPEAVLDVIGVSFIVGSVASQLYGGNLPPAVRFRDPAPVLWPPTAPECHREECERDDRAGHAAAVGRDGRDVALSVSHLSKAFGDRLAFDDVSFDVGRGEVFGFLGPNGAGKTTTVRTLGTLIAPTAGSATVAGILLTPENGVEIRRRIAVMPESPGLYLRLSVIENSSASPTCTR